MGARTSTTGRASRRRRLLLGALVGLVGGVAGLSACQESLALNDSDVQWLCVEDFQCGSGYRCGPDSVCVPVAGEADAGPTDTQSGTGGGDTGGSIPGFGDFFDGLLDGYDFDTSCRETPGDLSGCEDCCESAGYDRGATGPEGCGCTYVTEDSEVCSDVTESGACSACCDDAGFAQSIWFGSCQCSTNSKTRP